MSLKHYELQLADGVLSTWVDPEWLEEFTREMRDTGYGYALPPDRKLTFIRLWPPSSDGDSESQEYCYAPTPR